MNTFQNGFYSPRNITQTRNLLWQEGAHIKHIRILNKKCTSLTNIKGQTFLKGWNEIKYKMAIVQRGQHSAIWQGVLCR